MFRFKVMSIEDVEKIMDETKEAVEYQNVSILLDVFLRKNRFEEFRFIPIIIHAP